LLLQFSFSSSSSHVISTTVQPTTIIIYSFITEMGEIPAGVHFIYLLFLTKRRNKLLANKKDSRKKVDKERSKILKAPFKLF